MFLSIENVMAVTKKEFITVTKNRTTFVSIGLYVTILINLFSSHADMFKDVFPELISISTFLLTSFIFSNQLFLTEKINNTLEFLFTTPLKVTELIYGKSIGILSISSLFSLLLYLVFSISKYGLYYAYFQFVMFFTVIIILNIIFFPLLNIIAILQLLYGQIAALISNLLIFLLLFKIKNLLVLIGKVSYLMYVLGGGIVLFYLLAHFLFNKVNTELLTRDT